jgi:two-component system, NtrC family, sensor kinase
VLVSRKVVQPLVRLEQATTKIGQGDFGPIHHPGRIESEVDRLILAFNRMAEELEARQEQIIHSRKIASLGTLVSGVAHELNNPINNIILTIDSLTGSRKVTDERRRTMLEDILTQAVRASGIVKNLLDFSRSETALIEDLDIARILRETIQISENQITVSNINLHVDLATDLSKIKGNRQALQQVFINLLTNAVHAMPGGGELRIRACAGKDRKILITIQDTGSGIAEEHLPLIFDPFFTTKEVGQGTGLGLSVTHGIIKKHGGWITVDSTPGKGSTFTITLPIKEEIVDG